MKVFGLKQLFITIAVVLLVVLSIGFKASVDLFDLALASFFASLLF